MTGTAAAVTASFSSYPVRQLLQRRADVADISLTEVGAVIGLPKRTLFRVLTRERLRWDTADRVAVALGCHPCELWPDWFFHDRGLAGAAVGR